MRAIIKYQIGTYSGEHSVMCEEDEEDEVIIAKAKYQLRKLTSMSMCYESYKVIERIYD